MKPKSDTAQWTPKLLYIGSATSIMPPDMVYLTNVRVLNALAEFTP